MLAFFLLTFVAVFGLWQVDVSPALATQAPIAAYSFDAGEGSTLEDVTGEGHDGTIEGATWNARGKYGGALQFDGVDDCVQVPASAEFQFLEAEEFTLEAWVRPQGEGIEPLLQDNRKRLNIAPPRGESADGNCLPTRKDRSV